MMPLDLEALYSVDKLKAADETTVLSTLSGLFSQLTQAELVTDGFTPLQIWAQLDEVNSKLPLKKAVKAVETETQNLPEPEAATASSEDEDEDEDEDDDEDMDAASDDMELEEHGEDEEDEDREDERRSEADSSAMPTDWEERGVLDVGDYEDDLSEHGSDFAEELMGQDEASEEDEDEEEEEEEPEQKAVAVASSSSLGRGGEETSALRKRLAKLETEIERLEQEQLERKTWELMGETSGKSRPVNSLLETELELPFSHSVTGRANMVLSQMGEEEMGEEAGKKTSEIEELLRRRIKDQLFDDVVKKDKKVTSEETAASDGKTGIGYDHLDFTKPKTGLAETYAQEYSKEVLGNPTDEEMKISKDKQAARDLFAQLMHKLDVLTNGNFRAPKPLASQTPNGELPTIRLEEAVPITFVGSGTVGAVQEKVKRAKVVARDELDRDQKRALRNREKDKRRRKIHGELEGELEAGQLALTDLAKRKLGKKGRETDKKKRRVE